MSTKDDIQTNINSRLTSSATRIEGGTAEDIIGSVAYELANIVDTRIETILDNAFITTADSKHLILRGEELGIYKKEATNAYVYAKITNAAANTLIKAGFMAHTEDEIEFQSIEDVITDENGSTSVKMQCMQAGVLGNIGINTLTIFSNNEIQALQNAEITNIEAGYDGFETETTEEYRQRILEYIKDNAINSNAASYQKWAKSVNGVNKVIVEDAFIAGAGKVNVYISALNNSMVSYELIEAVKSKIKKEQIINANVTINSLTPVEINIEASILIEEGKNIQSIKNELREKILAYLEKTNGNVSYLYISNLLFGIEGILDVSNYLLNNDTESIQLSKLEIPYLNNIELNEIGG